MYRMYAEKMGWKIEMITRNETELGGFKELSFTVEGKGPTPASSSSRASTGSSGSPRPRPRAGCIPPP